MKKTYINPEMVIVPLMAKQMIAYSLNSVTGLDGVSTSDDDFAGGAADVKGLEFNTNIWDDEW